MFATSITHLCTSSAENWLSFTSFLSRWAIQPFLVLPVFLAMFHMIGWLPRRYGRRSLRLLVCASALVYLIALFPPTIRLAERALVRQIPHDLGTKADAVVILGRGEELAPSRVEAAAELWRARRAPLIFASGVWDAPRMVKRLEDWGIPKQSLAEEDCSRTTYENAKFTAMALKPEGVKRILLVTDGPHMWRSILTFESFGFDVIPVATPIPPLNRTGRARMVLREYAGLLTYTLMGRFSPDEIQASAVTTSAATTSSATTSTASAINTSALTN